MITPVLRVVKEQPYRLRKSLSFDDVRWASVLQLLVRRHGIQFLQADGHLRTFIRCIRTPFHPRWFWNTSLDGAEALIVQAVCEAHGADAVTIVSRTGGRGAVKLFDYRLELTLEPNRVSARAVLQCSGLAISVASRASMILVNTFALLAALGSYVAIIGTLLYVSAVIVVFLGEPQATVGAATRSFPIGIALLSGLVVTSAVIGRFIRRALSVLNALLRPTALKPCIDADPASNDDSVG